MLIEESKDLWKQLKSNYLRIAILDDSPSDSMLGKRVVIKLGINGDHISEFNDPTEFLNYFKEHLDEFTIIISDYNMPKINGCELLKELLELGFSGVFIIHSGSDIKEIEKELKTLIGFHELPVNIKIIKKVNNYAQEINHLKTTLKSLVCVEN